MRWRASAKANITLTLKQCGFSGWSVVVVGNAFEYFGIEQPQPTIPNLVEAQTVQLTHGFVGTHQ